jgi:hypothetical protein
MRTLPALALLEEMFYITDGILFWKKNPPRKNNFVGKEVGGPSRGGYRIVKLGGVRYLTHRIMYYMYTGEDPIGYEIDHIDGNSSNNHKENLRKATHSQNSKNRRSTTRNKSGHPGVLYRDAKKKWQASIRLNGRFIHLGYFENKEDAIDTYINACNSHFGEYSPWAVPSTPEDG